MNAGIGAMLHYLGGGSDHNPDEYYGKVIKSAELIKENNRFEIVFEDGITIHIWDDGQCCCENRYITCDDDLSNIIGGKLVKIETKPVDDIEDSEWGDVHEQVFIDIKTDKGFITFTTHNEHNGYYSGFGLTITEPE